jgi:cheW protein
MMEDTDIMMKDVAEIMQNNFVQTEEEEVIPTKKFLAFESDKLSYAIDADYVKEIIMVNTITRLPKLPAFIRGVINLRGQVVPIMDMRIRMGRSKTEFTDDTCIIVMNIDDVQVGLLIDAVSQMVDIPEVNISTLPLSKHQELVDGIIRINGTVLLIISIDEIMKKVDEVPQLV